jgi:ElaB/YqjD/DUF883 family membrane-anchored ribosome-binding protein
MKSLSVALIILTFSLSAFAQKEEMIAKGKEVMISNIDKRISVLQQTKTCISASSSKEELKECRKKMHDQMKEIKEDAQEGRQQMRSKFKEMKDKREKKTN